MSHIESVEARRLFAVTPTPDVSFASGGRLSFPIDQPVLDVLATHGEIYVQVYQRSRSRIAVFKYNDAGVPDTAWGRGGYIVPTLLFEQAQKQIFTFAMVRDSRTGGLLLGGVNDPIEDDDVYDPTASVAVERHAANGELDTAWGKNGQVAYAEPKTALSLERVVALPHKKILLALGREELLGTAEDGKSSTRGGPDDVALLKFDTRGRYDRTFNNGHALRVADGNYRSVHSDVDDETTMDVEDSTVPTFGDVQFFTDETLRVVSTREQTHQTRMTYNVDVITYAGKSVFSAESTALTADGKIGAAGTQSYVLKRVTIDDGGNGNTHDFRPMAAVASADGKGVAVLADVDSSSGTHGGTLLRVGPGYRSSPEVLPDVLGKRYLGNFVRTGSGVVLVQSSGTDGDYGGDTLRPGPGVLSLGRDLAVGRNRVLVPLTYFPAFSLDTMTLDDNGRLLTEGTNTKTNTFDVTRYA